MKKEISEFDRGILKVDRPLLTTALLGSVAGNRARQEKGYAHKQESIKGEK